MVNLVIDFGNTRIKAAIFKNDQLLQSWVNLSLDEAKKIKSDHSPEHVIVSSVTMSKDEISNHFGSEALILNHQLKLPYRVDYKTPTTLGLDRMAAAAGACTLFPGDPCLVIDTGTCITYEVIDDQGVYRGGAISPGITMRFKSLHTFTANLPLVELSEMPPLTGQSTKESIESGVIYGIIAEITQIIRMYKDKFRNLRIIICGGDANFFEKQLKADIFASPELVLIGLNRILIDNV